MRYWKFFIGNSFGIRAFAFVIAILLFHAELMDGDLPVDLAWL
jgi:hypothetical protein